MGGVRCGMFHCSHTTAHCRETFLQFRIFCNMHNCPFVRVTVIDAVI